MNSSPREGANYSRFHILGMAGSIELKFGAWIEINLLRFTQIIVGLYPHGRTDASRTHFHNSGTAGCIVLKVVRNLCIFPLAGSYWFIISVVRIASVTFSLSWLLATKWVNWYSGKCYLTSQSQLCSAGMNILLSASKYLRLSVNVSNGYTPVVCFLLEYYFHNTIKRFRETTPFVLFSKVTQIYIH